MSSALPEFILASASPTRARVLREAGVRFRVVVSDVDEDAAVEAEAARRAEAGEASLTPADTALILAQAKARAVAPQVSGAVVLGCDSVFELGGQVYGKPCTAEVARQRWALMRGASGVLHTGHWLVDTREDAGAPQAADGSGQAELGDTVSTTVHFAAVTEAESDAYIATGEPLLCAGAFTLDGRGAALVDGVEGDPHSVLGVSVQRTRALLAELGLSLTDFSA
ncbi:MAG: nucleoside triphosphate pyrophosphatase [Micrococcus sp.]|nr:nucleoside triphosphate pyrophosphatase [Micrococcus sp.]